MNHYAGGERRGAQRVTHGYLIRFREEDPAGSTARGWDIASALNISITGIAFLGSRGHLPGAGLQVKIRNPRTQTDIVCRATVLRCEELGTFENAYRIAARIEEIAPNDREAFRQSIDFYLSKTRGKGNAAGA